MIITFCLQN